MTPAERHSWLVQRGTDRFIETFRTLFKNAAEGGRLPGMEVPTKEELLAFFQNTNADYWATLGVIAPQEAVGQLQQWQKAEGY